MRRIAETWPDDRDAYAYFNNDPGGAAVLDAMVFARVAAAAGLTVTRTPVRLPSLSPPPPTPVTATATDAAARRGAGEAGRPQSP
ncbi:hypothetical protein GCM10010365_27140 [Streptomyces poonensis]|uniref:DUF72 domain-containing protein n=1 Tax=Streptomyces poonensis TaxID=68255 RepID=A0A918PFN6_9ACTN|nr:hypothetical protein GCM10010365_27140 [Streptomyces poonensis]GLJ88658.1 hypothetical protein GCM10017589_12580 [Streptomyces poonensis]